MEENMELDLPSQVASANQYLVDDIETSCNEAARFEIDLFAKYFDPKSIFSELYHYRVEVKVSSSYKNIKPSSEEGEKRKQVIDELFDLYKCKKFKYIYDGKKSLFTSIKLLNSEKCTGTISVKTGERFDITIKQIKKYTHAVSLSFLQTMTMHSEDVEHNDLLQLNKALVDRYNSEIHFDTYSIFHVENFDIGKSLEIWRKYEQSIKLTEHGPAYVLGVKELVFHRAGCVIEYINDLLRIDITKINRLFTSDEVNEIKSALRDVNVRVFRNSKWKKYTIKDLFNKPATDVILKSKNPEVDQKSIPQYFEKWNIALLYPHLPCLEMKSNKEYRIHIPLEICKVNACQQKSDYNPGSEKTSDLIGNSSPIEQNKQNDSKKKLSLLMDIGRENVQHISISRQISKCLEGSQIFHDTEKWGKKNDSWIVMSFVDKTQLPLEKIAEFVKNLKVAGLSLKLLFGRFLGIHITERNETIHNAFQKEVVKNATLAVILLSKRNPNNYNEVKFIAKYKLRLVTKCITDDTICTELPGQNFVTARNICSSIGVKLRVSSCDLTSVPEIFSRPTVVFGAVTLNLMKYTFASVVGSLDAYPSRYKHSFSVEEESGKATKECIEDLENIVKKILISFYHHTKGKYPENIIFFRGKKCASDFHLLIHYEVTAIQKACKDIVGCILPVTFMVVSRQPEPLKSRSRKKGDGMVNFFLSNDPSDKPTYYVVHDDYKLSAEELKQLTCHMCYSYMCNRYLSETTPVRLAYHAANRAKEYACCQCEKDEIPVEKRAIVMNDIYEME